jgi:hypothetical protein
VNLDSTLHQDGAESISLREALLTSRFAAQREDDVDNGSEGLPHVVLPPSALEVAQADDEVTHFGPHPIALIRSGDVCHPLMEHILDLENRRDDRVDIALTDGVAAPGAPRLRLLKEW